MKTRFLHIPVLVLGLLLCGALGSCTNDPTEDPAIAGEGEAWVTLAFGDSSFDEVQIATRSTLSIAAESRVTTIYVFIFDQDGNRVYGRNFDASTRVDDETTVRNGSTNYECWYRKNQSSETDDPTHGCIRLKAPVLTNGIVVLLSNVNADMVNISPEQLDFIRSYDELQALTATLNQLITARNGYFPMTGEGRITITKVENTTTANIQTDPGTILLTRLDAKVSVMIRVAKGEQSEISETLTSGTGSVLKEFVPDSWQVMRLPKKCSVLEDQTSTSVVASPDDYFDSTTVNFEDAEKDEEYSIEGEDDNMWHTFSFYMLENRASDTTKPAPQTFYDRDRRTKDDSGAYQSEGDQWLHAPEQATYLVIKGEVVMEVDVANTGKNQPLIAQVTYYIHLGDFSGGHVNDFNIARNTHYTYKITIKGVHKIEVEVEKQQKDEEQPGATGDVYVAKEQIYTFDAHYGQRVFAFDQEFITPETVTWYVSSPFGRAGMPNVIQGVEVPTGLDYRWVHFWINSDEDTYLDENGSPQHYTDIKHNRAFPGKDAEGLLDVIDFCRKIKEEKKRFDASITNKATATTPDAYEFSSEPDFFKQETDTDYDPGYQRRFRAYVTVFVDEYYYEAHPITGETSPELWKRFVNKPNRMMHILCDSHFSPDSESSTTGSVVTIRQQSIQTVYEPTAADVSSAWGTEVEDETPNMWFYHTGESYSSNNKLQYPSNAYPLNQNNTSAQNGLYNTGFLWGVLSGTDGNATFQTNLLWSKYLDYDRDNDYTTEDGRKILFLQDDPEIATMRYACMMRNRDNNGDGKIDADEVRWYLAAINQLSALYLGDQGLKTSAMLYPKSNSAKGTKTLSDGTKVYLWRNHVVSSTKSNIYNPNSSNFDNSPFKLWAEEGLSTGSYTMTWNKNAPHSIRCVRNLGLGTPPTDSDESREETARQRIADKEYVPDALILADGPGLNGDTTTPDANSVYTFDLSHINAASLRYMTTHELEPTSEHATEARTYSGFTTGAVVSGLSYARIHEQLTNGEQICPEGYHVPNIREASIMAFYIPSAATAWWSPFLVSTWYSNSGDTTYGGNGNDQVSGNNPASWQYDAGSVVINNNATQVRCVKDM